MEFGLQKGVWHSSKDTSRRGGGGGERGGQSGGTALGIEGGSRQEGSDSGRGEEGWRDMNAQWEQFALHSGRIGGATRLAAMGAPEVESRRKGGGRRRHRKE